MQRRLMLLMLPLLVLMTLPSRSPSAEAAVRVRWGYYVGYDKTTSLPSLKAHVADMNYVSPWYGYNIDTTGALKGSDDPEVTGIARSAGAKVLPLVQNSARYADFSKVISSPTKRTSMVQAISSMVATNGYQGVNIDFEGITATDRPYLTSFMRELYNKMRPQGKLVTMAVPAKTWDATTGWAGAYDYAALAPYADMFVIMAYDYHSAGSKPGPISPVNWVRDTAVYARSMFGANKLLVGLALYGYDWNTTTGAKATATKYPDIAYLRRTYGATLSYDTAS